jgi:hypothetical protein
MGAGEEKGSDAPPREGAIWTDETGQIIKELDD